MGDGDGVGCSSGGGRGGGGVTGGFGGDGGDRVLLVRYFVCRRFHWGVSNEFFIAEKCSTQCINSAFLKARASTQTNLAY